MGTLEGKAEPVYAETSGIAKIHFLTFNGDSEGVLLESRDANGNPVFGMVDSGEDWDYPDGSDPKYPLRSGIVTNAGYDEKVVSYLKELGVNSENFLFYIGSHPHSDHIGTADTVIREFRPQNLYLMPYDDSYIDTSQTDVHLWDNQYVYDQTIAAAEETGINLIQDINDQNSTLSLGSFQIQIVNYDPSYQTQKTYDANWFCLGVIVQANGNTAFLSGNMGDDDGDLTRIMENYSAVWDLEVLEVNHHGLFDSMTDAFVQATHPDIMILPGAFSNVKTSRLNLIGEQGTKFFAIPAYTDQKSVVVDFQSDPVTTTVDGSFRIYKDRDGKMRAYRDGLWCSGLFEQDGALYYAKENGILAVNEEIYVASEDQYYRADENGQLKAFGGWVERNGNKYYVKEDGSYVKGWLDLAGARYYMDPSTGAMKTGWIKDQNQWYLMSQEDGKMLKGWQQTGNQWYYLDEQTGVMKSNCWVQEPQSGIVYRLSGSGERIRSSSATIDGYTLQFDSEGRVTGPSWIIYNGGWRCLKNGLFQTGWQRLNNDWYYFNEDGSMKADEFCEIDHDYYYFRSWGGMQYNNWYQNPSDGNWYYLRSWGGALNNGWNRLDGDWYYFDGDCTMKKDELVQLDGDLYYFRSWGGMQYNNWYQNPSDGNWYYLRSWGGALNNGWNRLDGDWYYFNGDCTMKKDELCWLDGNLYYFRSWGGRQYNNWYRNPSDGKWYLFDSNGRAYRNCRAKNGIDTYYFNADGSMYTGWKEENGKTYYYRDWGGMAYSMTLTIDGVPCTFNFKGELVKKG